MLVVKWFTKLLAKEMTLSFGSTETSYDPSSVPDSSLVAYLKFKMEFGER